MPTVELPDGTYTAVIDNVEDGYATVFFERDGDEVGNAVIAAGQFPGDAQHADAVLTVTLSEGEIEEATYKSEETTERSSAAQDRFDRLSRRPPSDDDN
jgi:hypothetical protein